MNCISYLDDLAREFCEIIATQPNTSLVPTKDYGWENHRWSSPTFRLAHVEIFNQDRFMVIHCCVFPHVSDPSPIFGFDVISGESKVTGLFMDLSPTVRQPEPFCDFPELASRQRPEWGDIFSEHFLACRPTAEQLVRIGDRAKQLLTDYLPSLGQLRHVSEPIAAAQDHYCLQQRRNEHTRRALINLIGQELTDEFMTTVLFPTVSGT